MSISLVDVDKDKLSDYVYLEKMKDLSYYMSRTRPDNYDVKPPSMLYWKYISHNEAKIGAIWIEKEKECATTATLGIFIADDENTSKGIGSHIIDLAIAQAKEDLNISQVELHVRDTNVRAIRCYEKCGFRETSRFTKNYLNEDVEVIIMRNI